MRERRANGFDVSGAEIIGGEKFYEICAGFMGKLGLGGGVGAEHDGPIGCGGGLGDFGASDGADDELGTGGDSLMGGFGVEHGADSEEGLFTEVFGGLSDSFKGAGSGHGHFDGMDAARQKRFGKRDDLLSGESADDGDDPRLQESVDDIGFGAHGGERGGSDLNPQAPECFRNVHESAG